MHYKGIILSLLIFLSASLEAQVLNSVTKFLPADLIEDRASFMLERRVNGSSSLTFTLGIGFDYEANISDQYSLSRSYGLDIGYRRFIASILDDAPKKLYIGLNARGEFVQYESSFEDSQGNQAISAEAFPVLGAGISLGYQFIVNDRFAFDFFYNPVLRFPLPSEELKIQDKSADDISIHLLRPGIGIGIALNKFYK